MGVLLAALKWLARETNESSALSTKEVLKASVPVLLLMKFMHLNYKNKQFSGMQSSLAGRTTFLLPKFNLICSERGQFSKGWNIWTAADDDSGDFIKISRKNIFLQNSRQYY